MANRPFSVGFSISHGLATFLPTWCCCMGRAAGTSRPPLMSEIHEALRVPALRSPALLRKHSLRELRAQPRLFAGEGNDHRVGAGQGRLEGVGGAERTLPLLRQCAAWRLQLAGPHRFNGPVLPRLSP